MKAIVTATGLAAFLAASPSWAADRYTCTKPGVAPTTIEIDAAANTIRMATGSGTLASICQVLSAGYDNPAEALAQCHVKVDGDVAAMDIPLRNGQDMTAFAIFDRRDMTFQVLGRGYKSNLRIATTCKPL